ncbi:alcohol dehydrogenase catalytic domain-containing protein, partial [Streptomyces broussonetiae]
TRALGLNRAESMFRLGEYGTDPVFPSGLGHEAAGVVGAVGTGVTGLRVGDAVSVVPSFTMTDYPVHGETAHVLGLRSLQDAGHDGPALRDLGPYGPGGHVTPGHMGDDP